MNSNNISRRGFLGASAVVMAGVAGLTATGCSAESSLEAVDKHELPVDPAKGGEWISAACWHNCGGRCMNKVMVKDGAVVRQKTDDTHEDSIEYPQQRGCARGKTQQQQCFGADRILHPLKRKGWQPGGGEKSNGQMRGKRKSSAFPTSTAPRVFIARRTTPRSMSFPVTCADGIPRRMARIRLT